MRSHRVTWLAMLVIMLTASLLMAGDEMKKASGETAGGDQPEMQFGPPEQLKEAAYVIGSWIFKGEMRMTAEAPWQAFEAGADFSYVCGGAAIQMDWRSPSPMGEMIGLSISAYDREKQEWQETWVDNLESRIIMMTGNEKDGKRIMTGDGISQGEKYHMRNTSWDITDKSFKWQMEISMDGKNWYVSMKGEYIKK